VERASSNCPFVDEPNASADSDPRIGSVLGGRYRIVKVLGAGAMGVVYRGEHVHMKKAVAVKILHRHMTTLPEVVARFEREAVAAGRIEHPNVAAATDFGKLEDGSFYLALEYVEGKSLASLIRQGPLPSLRVLLIARQIAEGLGAAHAADIVHRDLKPDNVMLIEREGFPDFVKLLDFGIAKVPLADGVGQQPLTQIGTIFGTPEYMSPEQAQGHSVDQRADLYALGVMLFEMLTGKLPFDADDVVVLITRHVTQPPPPLPNSVPTGIQSLVRSLLEKEPEDRPPGAVALVAAIDRLLDDASIAPPGSIPPGARSSPPQGDRPAALSVFARAAHEGSRLARRAARSASRYAARARQHAPWLDRPVRIGPLEAPLAGLLAFGLGLVLLGMLITLLVAPRSRRADGARDGAGSSGARAPSIEPELERHQKLVARAEAGDLPALAELEKQRKKSLEDWRALGHGRCVRGEMAGCMAAYKSAVEAFSELRKDVILIADVRKGSVDSVAYEQAMRLAAHQLGSGGLDALYDAWAATRSDQALAAINRRARAFLDDTAVQEHASPELGLVLDLERAERRRRCRDADRLLSRVIERGDARSVSTLDRFASRRGCGLLDLGDCWRCLRGTNKLADARAAAAKRPAPTFTVGAPAATPRAD